MRRLLSLSFIFVLLCLPFAHAAELAPEGTPQRKFQRGILNTFFAPVELSHALAQEKTKDEWLPSWLDGFGRGSVFMFVRAVTGIYEIVTAPIPSPPDYRPPYHPEFALERLNSPRDAA